MVVLPCWQKPPQVQYPPSSLVIRTLSGNGALRVKGRWLRGGNYPDGVSIPPSGAGDRLVRVGAIVFFIGALATLVTVAPLFLGTDPFPSFAYALCMLMGVGFLIAAAGVVRSAWAASPKRTAR